MRKTNLLNPHQHRFGSHPSPKINPSFQSNPNFVKELHAILITKGTQKASHWTYVIKSYLSQGLPRVALLIHSQNHHTGIRDPLALPLLLKLCTSLSLLLLGRSLHAESVKVGVVTNVMVGTSLVSLYSKCNDIVQARWMFDEMPERNVVTWNAMIGGYSRKGDMDSALALFEQMSELTTVTWTVMIDGFARIGDTVSAWRLFDRAPIDMKSVVTWTVMVDGYARNGEMESARRVFEEMPQRNYYVWSSMIDGYCKKGDTKEARKIFDRIPVRNLVNWNAIIAGYAQNGFCQDALEVFQQMRSQGFKPDEFTVASVLSACGQLGSLDTGRDIHELIKSNKINLNQFVLNGLVDMYSKCGELKTAKEIFEGMPERNEVCWNAMISGHAVHGQSKEALRLFGRMEKSKEKPNEITFLVVLSACAHGGFVKEGLDIFAKMETYGLFAAIEHYGCLVDLLGRAGRIREAYDLIKRMPMEPNTVVLGALLGACMVHMDLEMAERVVAEVGASCDDDSRYVLLSNIYAASNRWEAAEKMRVVMVKNGIQKTPGCSTIVVGTMEPELHAGHQACSRHSQLMLPRLANQHSLKSTKMDSIFCQIK